MRALAVGIILALILIPVFSFKRKPEEDDDPTIEQAGIIRDAVNLALTKFDRAVVQNAERIYQHETDGYSKQFTFATGSAGMEAVLPIYPYGWNSLVTWWAQNPGYRPLGVTSDYNFERNSQMPLIMFPSFTAGFMTLCEFLQEHNNNPGRWHSLLMPAQMEYNQIISGYTPAYS